jgi:Protein of unknown function (DUF3095)
VWPSRPGERQLHIEVRHLQDWRAPELIADAAIPESLDDGAPTDLSGLSCRWDELRSRRGKMVTLIVNGAPDPGEIYSTIMRLAGQEGNPRPVRLDTLSTRWPPKGFVLEARARRRGGSTSTANSLHVHFVDGGGGGYTNAAKNLKAAVAGDTHERAPIS